MRSGFVTIVGRPNVGKSTLLNAIMERKIAITSTVAGTTRNMIQGIYTDDESQIVFIDTPGIHKPQNKLGKILNEQAYSALDSVDLVLLVIDVTEKIGTGDMFIIDKLKEAGSKVILIINKIDKITYKTIKKYLTDDIMYYDKDTVTNVSLKFEIGELIREKILLLTKEEVPHSVTVLVHEVKEDKNAANIVADIIVDRENLKKILVGKNGSMIKNIGIKSRTDIEELLGKKVYLELFVKVINNWKEKDRFLNEIGYEEFNKF